MPRICITTPNKKPQPYRFPLDTEVVTIGRSAANDVVIEHGSISSHHCEMVRIPGGFILQDTDSTNGLFLEGDRMEIIDLKHELDCEVGDVVLNYQLTEEESEELAEEKFKPRQKKKKEKKEKKSPPKPAPAAAPALAPAPAIVVSNGNNSAREFGIFVIFAILALGAFWMGLSSAHRDNIPREERLGRSLLKDMQNPPTPSSAKDTK